MQSMVKRLVEYLNEVGLHEMTVEPRPEAAGKLPVFLGRIYDVYWAELEGRAYCLLIWHRGAKPSPAKAKVHADKASELLGRPAVLVFPSLSSFQRRRLVGQRVPFIVPGRQIYLPMFMLDSRVRTKGELSAHDKQEARKILSAPAQMLLLHFLQKEHRNGCSLGDWAVVLGCSASTMTRVCRELLRAELCRVDGNGRLKYLLFSLDRRQLWERALPLLTSPLRRSVNIRIADENAWLLKAGESALAALTMLAEGFPMYAMASKSLAAALRQGDVESVQPGDEGDAVLELWKYDPAQLSTDGRNVDRLSLYLSLQAVPDERVQQALNDMIEGMQW